ncbi:MAG: lysophospholipid acyltransferase family protein, partial [Vicinamibacterales bacterium]
IDSTLDLRVFGHEHVNAVVRAGRPFLVVVWHGRGLLPIFFFQSSPLVVYSSQSRTGRTPTLSRYIRKLTLASLRHLGYRVLDASTFTSESRGVIRFLQYLERGSGGLIAADGPGGPMFRAKPGAAYVAKRTGVALLPVAASIRDAIALDSWDRFEIPRPFTKAVLAIGEAIDVPEEIDDEGLAKLSADLELVLNDLTAQAEVEAFATPTS